MKFGKKLETAAGASVHKAAEVVRQSDAAQDEAVAAMKTIEELSDYELDQVAGGRDPYVSKDSRVGQNIVWSSY